MWYKNMCTDLFRSLTGDVLSDRWMDGRTAFSWISLHYTVTLHYKSLRSREAEADTKSCAVSGRTDFDF